MAAVVANQPVQPMRFGGGVAGASNVTLTISPAQGSQVSSGAGGNNFYKRQGGYRFQQPINMANDIMMMGDGPGRRLRKNVANVRRHVDYVATVLNHADARLWQYKRRQRPVQQPDELYQNTALPARCTPDVPVDCVLTKFVRAAMNKVKCPVYSLCWTPEGKRLITGASTGEFTLWNGTAFNFETILQAHDSAIRAMTWSYNEQWLVSADHDGFIKYWQPNMNNVHMYQAHKDEPIRALSFAPTDLKLASASDDGTGRIWDFARCVEERVLRGHGSEVRCIDWHPNKGLVVTGSRDSQQPVKLWDPKTAQCLSTLQDHKSSVMAVEWNRNGNWLLTAGRDHLIKLYDIRIMKEMHTFRGHKKEVTAVAWHPVHEGLFVSGGGDGSLAYWLIDSEKEVGLLEHAHDQAVWAMRWHPMGHILATGSNDNNTKFWARNRPGDTQEDIFGLASFTTNMVGALDKEREPKNINIRYEEDFSVSIIPGMGLDDDVVEKMNREISTGVTASNATMLLMPEDLNARQQAANIGAKRTLIKQPPPKKAQRQFERMWNVSKPGASGDDVGLDDEEAFQRPKPSLLGKAPPSMLSNSGLVAPGISPSGGKLMGGPPGFTGGRPTGPSALSGMPPGWQSQGQPSPSRGPPQQTQQPQRGQNLGPYNQQPATSRSMSSSQLPSSGGNTQLSTLNRPNPPQMPPGPIPPGFPFSALPPGMSPAMLAGLWPPGMMLTSGIPPQMASKSDVTLAGGGDIDYRVGTGAAQSSGSGDVDLRAQTSSLPRSSTQPQVPSSNDSWRAQDNSCSSAKNTMHDPRMRKQDDVMRDPRRRQPQESEQSNKQTRNTTSMENRRNWMPQISEYSSQNDQNGQQSYGYGNQPSQSEGYSGQETYDVDGYGNGYGSHDSCQDYDSGYCDQGQGYDRRRNHSGHGQSGNRYINQGYGGPDYSGGGPMRGGRSRGRGRGRPY